MKSFLVTILAIFGFQLKAQVKLLNQSLTDSSLGILYVGVENRLKLTGSKNLSNYDLNTSSGKILTRISNDEFIARVSTIDSCTIIISQKGKKDLTQKFRVEILKYPIATLNGLHDTVISKNRILASPLISVVIPECFYQHSFHVTSFQAIFIDGNDSTFTVAPFNRLSEEQIKLVRQQTSGCKIYFDGIRANSADSRTIKLDPFWIKIE